MFDFSSGDFLFIALVLLVIHGSMLRAQCLRLRQKGLNPESPGR